MKTSTLQTAILFAGVIVMAFDPAHLSAASEGSSADPARQDSFDVLLKEEAPLDDEVRERLSRLWQRAIEGSSDLADIERNFRLLNREVKDMTARIGQMRERIQNLPDPNSEADYRERDIKGTLLEYLEGRRTAMIDDQRLLAEEALAELRKAEDLSRKLPKELEVDLLVRFLTSMGEPSADAALESERR